MVSLCSTPVYATKAIFETSLTTFLMCRCNVSPRRACASAVSVVELGYTMKYAYTQGKVWVSGLNASGRDGRQSDKQLEWRWFFSFAQELQWLQTRTYSHSDIAGARESQDCDFRWCVAHAGIIAQPRLQTLQFIEGKRHIHGSRQSMNYEKYVFGWPFPSLLCICQANANPCFHWPPRRVQT